MRNHWGSWTRAPEPYRLSDAAQILETELVVVGAGIAGLSCALSAAQRGTEVTVLEKLGRYTARGYNIGVVNSSLMAKYGLYNDPDEVVKEWVARCGSRCDERLVNLFAYRSPEAMDWLLEILTRPEYHVVPSLQKCLYRGKTNYEIDGAHIFLEGPISRTGRFGGMNDVLECMYRETLKEGVRYLFHTPLAQLMLENGAVVGVWARNADGTLLAVKARKGVVLATGGMGGNDEMCEDLCPIANKVAAKVCGPKGSDDGDGHRAALWAGAAFEDTPFPPMMHPQAYFHSNFCFLHVNDRGERYMNEDSYLQAKSLNIIRMGQKYAWAVFDSAWPEKVPSTLEYGGGIFWGQSCAIGQPLFNREREQADLDKGLKNGSAVCADTPEALAEKMGVDRDGFVRTLRRYNEMCAAGHDDEFGKRRELLIPVDTPPYYARRFGPALLSVVGGVLVDTEMRVLNADRQALPGLYAIGNVAGGRYGVDYPMLVLGNSHGTALTFGYLLGRRLGGKP